MVVMIFYYRIFKYLTVEQSHGSWNHTLTLNGLIIELIIDNLNCWSVCVVI